MTATERKIAEYCRAKRISGMLRVALGGRVELETAVGYADAEARVPFGKDSAFTLYSLSKPFCAMGLLKLWDRGLVEPDHHPSRYLPEAAGFDPRVTIRHLLHHVSGLPDFEQTKEFSSKYAPADPADARYHVKLLSEYPSLFPPGTEGKYANVNYFLCALIVENVTGISYAEYMAREVFAPLGMENTVVDHRGLAIPHRVKGYALTDGVLTEVERSYDWMLGAGDLVATVDDVARLNAAIKERLLLREETWQAALTPSPVNGMGMGCTVSQWHGKRRITHNGGHRGFRTLHVQLPEEDLDLVFLSNCGFGNARKDLAELVYSHFYQDGDGDGSEIEMDRGYV